MRAFWTIVLLAAMALTLLLVTPRVLHSLHFMTQNTTVAFSIVDGWGPVAQLNWTHTPLRTVLDTGSIYLLSGSVPQAPTEGPLLTYYFAGPKASFRWTRASPTVDGMAFPPTSVGAITDSSVKELGIDSVLGLCPSPLWNIVHLSNGTFTKPTFVEQAGVSQLVFNFPKGQLQLSHSTVVARGGIPLTPQLVSPFPGIGYLTTAITSLDVVFSDDDSYKLTRVPAAPSEPHSYTVDYTDGPDQGSLDAIEWYCLFDTGTFPGIFYASASANLLSSRVAQTMIAGEDDPSNFTTANQVTFTFGQQSVTAHDVTVPTLRPTDVSDATTLMTVCGYDFQKHYTVEYNIDTTNNLPLSVRFL